MGARERAGAPCTVDRGPDKVALDLPRILFACHVLLILDIRSVLLEQKMRARARVSSRGQVVMVVLLPPIEARHDLCLAAVVAGCLRSDYITV